jgi:hypothetical protein
MSRIWTGVRVGAVALVWIACAALPGAAGAQTWSLATWSRASAGGELERAAATDWSGSANAGTSASVLRLADAERQPAPVPTRRGPVIRRMRPNTISLGIQAQYGGMRGSSRLADGFDQGPGYAFRFRYMLSSSTALGFSFEHERFGSIQPRLNVPGDFADSHVVVTTISAESVFYRHRERDTHPYFLVGFGYASPDVVFADEVASRVDEGAFLTGGIGFEHFIRPRLSMDGSIRVIGLIANSEFTSTGEIALGIHLYPGD